MNGGRVKGKVALVTGAGSGIGQAVAIRLAEEGATVVVTSRSSEHVDRTCTEVEGVAGTRPLGVQVDVGDRDQVRRAVDQVADVHGAIDVVVSNAGIDLAREPTIEEMTEEEWEHVLRVNLTGAFYLTRAALRHLRRGASIVTIGSAASIIGRARAAGYVASKGGLLQFTRALAVELAPRGVRANCVCPGNIDTPLTDEFLAASKDPERLRSAYAAEAPMNRLGTPLEVANCVLFLASDEASFVTGAALVVDGGMTIA